MRAPIHDSTRHVTRVPGGAEALTSMIHEVNALVAATPRSPMARNMSACCAAPLPVHRLAAGKSSAKAGVAHSPVRQVLHGGQRGERAQLLPLLPSALPGTSSQPLEPGGLGLQP